MGNPEFQPIRIIEKPKMRIGKITHSGEATWVGVWKEYKEAKLLDAYPEINKANTEYGTHLRLIRHEIARSMLVSPESRTFLVDCSPFPTDLFFGFERPGQELGGEIVYAYENDRKLILPTGKYRGEGSKNIALTSRDLTAEDIKPDGKNFVIDIPDTRIIAVEDFPSKMGWYSVDAVVGKRQVPTGSAPQDMGFVVRSESSYVGNLCLGVNKDGKGRDFIFLSLVPMLECGIVVEVPKEDKMIFETSAIKFLKDLLDRSDDAPSLKELVRLYEGKK